MLSCSRHSLKNIRFYFSREADHYSTLGVSHSATSEQIKTKYYRLAKLHHPDSIKSSDQSQFIKIKEAYTVIGNIQSRGNYDRKLRRQEQIQRQKQHNYYQAEINQKYSYGGSNQKQYSKQQKVAIRLGIFGLFSAAVYFMLGLRTRGVSDHELRKKNLILRGQNVKSSTGVIQKRRKLFEDERKQKKFDIVPIQMHFDIHGTAYTNQDNIKPNKKRGSTKKDKKSKELSDMPGIRKKHPKRPPVEREFYDEYI